MKVGVFFKKTSPGEDSWILAFFCLIYRLSYEYICYNMDNPCRKKKTGKGAVLSLLAISRPPG